MKLHKPDWMQTPEPAPKRGWYFTMDCSMAGLIKLRSPKKKGKDERALLMNMVILLCYHASKVCYFRTRGMLTDGKSYFLHHQTTMRDLYWGKTKVLTVTAAAIESGYLRVDRVSGKENYYCISEDVWPEPCLHLLYPKSNENTADGTPAMIAGATGAMSAPHQPDERTSQVRSSHYHWCDERAHKLNNAGKIKSKVTTKGRGDDLVVVFDLSLQQERPWPECLEVVTNKLSTKLKNHLREESLMPDDVAMEMDKVPDAARKVLGGYKENNMGLSLEAFVDYHWRTVDKKREDMNQDYVHAHFLGSPAAFRAMHDFRRRGRTEDGEGIRREVWTDALRAIENQKGG